MKCRRALASDYEELCRWWKGHGWTPVRADFLPTGFIIESDGIRLASGFLYMTNNAPIGMLEWVVTNPDNKGSQSYRALNLLVSEILKFAEYNMISAVYSKIDNAGLEKLYNKHGFVSGDLAVKDMTWVRK